MKLILTYIKQSVPKSILYKHLRNVLTQTNKICKIELLMIVSLEINSVHWYKYFFLSLILDLFIEMKYEK